MRTRLISALTCQVFVKGQSGPLTQEATDLETQVPTLGGKTTQHAPFLVPEADAPPAPTLSHVTYLWGSQGSLSTTLAWSKMRGYGHGSATEHLPSVGNSLTPIPRIDREWFLLQGAGDRDALRLRFPGAPGMGTASCHSLGLGLLGECHRALFLWPSPKASYGISW